MYTHFCYCTFFPFCVNKKIHLLILFFFSDIGTDFGGASLYEDDQLDQFNLEHLLPSNFNMNQLDLLPSSPDGRQYHHLQHHNNNQHILNAHGAENSMTITPKSLMENNNTSHNLSLHPSGGHSSGAHSSLSHGGSAGHNASGPSSGAAGGQTSLPSAIGMSLYPETTISPMAGPPSGLGGHLRNLEPMQPMPLKNVIKQEPLAYIKREDNNNAGPHLMQLGGATAAGPGGSHPGLHAHQHLLNAGYIHNHPGVSPISPGPSMGSPGSPPEREKSHVAMAILNNSRASMQMNLDSGVGPLQNGPMIISHIPQGLSMTPNNLGAGGGKMPSAGSSRKKSTSTGNPEEDELVNIPSLQMRIKILQQRVKNLTIKKKSCT